MEIISKSDKIKAGHAIRNGYIDIDGTLFTLAHSNCCAKECYFNTLDNCPNVALAICSDSDYVFKLSE